MFTAQLWILLGAFGLIVLKIVSLLVVQRRLRKLMPPGPAGLPLLGNVFQLPQFQWLRFTEWKEQYGPIFSLNLAGQPLIVLNDFTTAGDLLDRRSNVYSGRPRFIVASEILTGGLFLALLPYGDLWRRMRKAAHEGFSMRASTSYQPLQEKEASLLVSHLLEDPSSWHDHFKRSAASTVLGAVYGWPPIDKESDPVVERINAFMHRVFSATLPGAYLVEIIPSMLYLPDWIATWKRKAKGYFKNDAEMFESFMDGATIQTWSGSPCFATILKENLDKLNLSSREAAWVAGIMFGAGAETTATALCNFVLAMTLYPNVMRRAQAQIDLVVGRERMPTFADQSQMPYVEAMVKEVLRWRPVGPIGMPRCTTQDDWYKGYFIPKGTIVLYNIWAMNRDPAYFPDFDEFRPDRFLDSSGQLLNSIPDTHGFGHLTYGSGRRVCVGKDMANQSLFINIAAMLWAFDIDKVLDKDGQPITPSRTDCVDQGLVVWPAPFQCTILPRTKNVADVIHSFEKE